MQFFFKIYIRLSALNLIYLSVFNKPIFLHISIFNEEKQLNILSLLVQPIYKNHVIKKVISSGIVSCVLECAARLIFF
jgi:hypothetical protein